MLKFERFLPVEPAGVLRTSYEDRWSKREKERRRERERKKELDDLERKRE